MPIGGLTPTGFVAPTVQEIVDDLNAQFLTTIDAGLDLAPDQPMGQIIGIFAEKLAEVWEVVATTYNAMNPDAAEGNLLDNICAITGTRRRSAKYSTVTATVNLNASTTVPINSVASVNGQPANRWVLTAPVTNSGGSPASFSSSWRSEQPGPFAANAGTLTVIETPVVGWNSITNAADAIEGIPEDTDAVLRVERENELAAAGACTIDAIRADILQVAGVVQCYVFENDTLITDANGLPAKSFRVVVWDGPGSDASDTELAQAIWNNKPSGISTDGNTSATATDSQGNPRTVYFTRATQVPIYFTLTTTPGSVTTAQRQAIKDAMAAYALSHQNLGVSVIALAYHAIALGVSGISDVPTFFLDVTASPAATANIPITNLQIATVSTTHILVDGS